MTEFVIAAASAPLNIVGAVTLWQWWRGRAVRRAERIERLAFCIEAEFLDAYAPGWQEGECSVRAVKRAQRESLRPRPDWVLELAC
ncbi:hypothetical protein RN51_01664 [Microbacterium oxydans]|uniref:Uncharacterized protein n=1 Tax=Microbacterium oxydans TaxID=82380 RepID=A0A0F0KR18_9MICO|nr:hypothetical protein [Microbacterium oxydans]KJL22919.1 hypothetical protein RN51_01664 [Microbacterium oxydans]